MRVADPRVAQIIGDLGLRFRTPAPVDGQAPSQDPAAPAQGPEFQNPSLGLPLREKSGVTAHLTAHLTNKLADNFPNPSGFDLAVNPYHHDTIRNPRPVIRDQTSFASLGDVTWLQMEFAESEHLGVGRHHRPFAILLSVRLQNSSSHLSFFLMHYISFYFISSLRLHSAETLHVISFHAHHRRTNFSAPLTPGNLQPGTGGVSAFSAWFLLP